MPLSMANRCELPTEPVNEVEPICTQKLADAEKRQVLLAHAELDNFRRRNLARDSGEDQICLRQFDDRHFRSGR